MSYEYKFPEGYSDLLGFANKHIKALEPQDVNMFETVTTPPSRGTPYFNKTIKMPVAASMGFWTNIGDYDAPAQLVYGAKNPMKFKTDPIFSKYFAYSGMNVAFRSEWYPWCKFINNKRFDDIFAGYLFQKKAYSMGYCFNLNGLKVKHARQSNVWQNLKDESI